MISPARAPFHWTEALNGREWATVVWAAVALVVMLARGDTRPSVVSVFRVALHRAILTPVLLLLVYVAAVVFVATRVSLWNERLIGATLAWIAASALVGFFKINEVPDERHPLRAAFRRALAITVLVDAYVNFAVFPFAIELVAIPFLFVLGGVMVVAEMKDEFEIIRGPLKGFAGILGLGVFAHATVAVIGDLSHDPAQLGKSLVLPLWLNLAFIPFRYVVATFAVYQTTFLFLSFAPNATKGSLRRAKRALLLSVGFRPYVLGEFQAPWPYRLNAAPTLADARRVASELRAARESVLSEQIQTAAGAGELVALDPGDLARQPAQK